MSNGRQGEAIHGGWDRTGQVLSVESAGSGGSDVPSMRREGRVPWEGPDDKGTVGRTGPDRVRRPDPTDTDNLSNLDTIDKNRGHSF